MSIVWESNLIGLPYGVVTQCVLYREHYVYTLPIMATLPMATQYIKPICTQGVGVLYRHTLALLNVVPCVPCVFSTMDTSHSILVSQDPIV